MTQDAPIADGRTDRTTWLVLLCLAAAVVTWLSCAQMGPVADPPPVGAMLEDLQTDSVVLHRQVAREVEAGGASVFERLAAALKASEPEERALAARGLPELGRRAVPLLLDMLNEDSAVVRRHAAQALGEMGTEAAPAGPALLDALSDPDRGVRAAASHAVSQIVAPEEAASALIPLLDDKEHAVRAAAASALEAVADHADAAVPKLAVRTEDKYPAVRVAAAQALDAIGPEAAEAAPALVRLLVEASMESAIARASLVQIGEPAVDPLMAALRSPNRRAQWLAAQALSEIGEPAVKSLLEVAGSAESRGRPPALSALALMEPRPAEAETVVLDALRDGVPPARAAATLWYSHAEAPSAAMEAAVFETARSENPYVVRAALRALTEGREATVELLELLEEVAQSPEEPVRVAALRALAALREGAAPAMPTLLRALRDDSENVRREAIRALRYIGPEAEETVPLLIELLRSDSAQERREAAEMLGVLSERPDEAVPTLAEATADGDANVRVAALNAVRQFGQEAAEAVPAVLDALDDRETRVRTAAALALPELPLPQEEAVEAVSSRLDKETEQPTLRALARALGEVGRGSQRAVQVLAHTLSTAESGRVRESAAQALEQIGPEARQEALDELIEAAYADHVLLSTAAWGALAGVAPGDPRAVTALTDALHAGPASLRQSACQAIGRMGQQGAAAVPDLVRVLQEDPSVDVRAAAARNVVLLGPAAAQAVPALERNRALDIPELTRAVDYALEQIRENPDA